MFTRGVNTIAAAIKLSVELITLQYCQVVFTMTGSFY